MQYTIISDKLYTEKKVTKKTKPTATRVGETPFFFGEYLDFEGSLNNKYFTLLNDEVDVFFMPRPFFFCYCGEYITFKVLLKLNTGFHPHNPASWPDWRKD